MIHLVDVLMTQAATPSHSRSEDENDQLFREAADALTDLGDALIRAAGVVNFVSEFGAAAFDHLEMKHIREVRAQIQTVMKGYGLK